MRAKGRENENGGKENWQRTEVRRTPEIRCSPAPNDFSRFSLPDLDVASI
jgi:hypothetical protein